MNELKSAVKEASKAHKNDNDLTLQMKKKRSKLLIINKFQAKLFNLKEIKLNNLQLFNLLENKLKLKLISIKFKN